MLELIIAITLTGLIMILAFSAIRLGTRSWTSVESATATTDEVQLVYGFLRRELSQAQMVSRNNQTEQNTSLKGSAQSLKFIAPMPGRWLGVWGLYQFTLQFVPEDSGTSLQVSYWLDLPPASPGSLFAEDLPRTLLTELETGEFSYYGKLAPEEPADWHTEWLSDESLPRLVKVRLHDPASAANWPDLIIPIQAQGSR